MGSKIEDKLAAELGRRNIRYRRNRKIREFELDFYIKGGKFELNVEADGFWYHLVEVRDQYRDGILNKMGIDVIRFSGSEIRDDVKRCGRVVQKYIKDHSK